MSYYFAKTIDRPFDEAIAAAKAALAEQGFGVITEIDIAKTMKAKIGEDFHPYVILGACNPRLAFEALKLENKVGAMLPCNVVVQDVGGGRTEVAAIDPVASMQSIPNAALKEKAALIAEMLKAVIAKL